MQLIWLATAIVTTVAYHLILKVTPGCSSPFLSLAVTYALGATAFLAIYAVTPARLRCASHLVRSTGPPPVSRLRSCFSISDF